MESNTIKFVVPDDAEQEMKAIPDRTSVLADMEEMPDKGLSMDGRAVRLGGLVAETHAKATKKGAMMGFLTLEDTVGQAECLLFPRVYELYGRELKEDSPVIVSGRLSVREDEAPKVIVDTVEPLVKSKAETKPASEAPRPGGGSTNEALEAKAAKEKLYLRMKRQELEQAGQLLRQVPGDVPVYIHLPEEGITLLSPREWWVKSGREGQAVLMRLLPVADMKTVIR